MSKVALADTLREWDSILGGMTEIEALDTQTLRELRTELAAMTAAVRDLALEQADLEGRRQAVTQQLRITRRRGLDLTIKVKAAIKSTLGHRNELLARFGIQPMRSRRKPEEVGVSVYPRPDLLAAAGLTQNLPNGVPAEEN